MASFSKQLLSGSTNGRGIQVDQTATAGTLLHTATATANEFDEIYLYLYNSHTADVEVTLEFGGVTVPDDQIVMTIPFDAGLVLVLPGLILNGGVVLRAFAATVDVIVATGYVNRINQAP